MTPVYLNPPSSPCPLVDQTEDHDHRHHLKLFVSPHLQASSSLLSCPAFLDSTQDERGSVFEKSLQKHDEKADKPISHGSCDHHHQAASASSIDQSVEEDGNSNPHKLSLCQREDIGDRSKSSNGSVQWMSSKMRLMQKIINPNFTATDHQPVKFMNKFQDIQHHAENCKLNSPSNSSNSNNNSSTRVCSDCNTTTTPLWRSGPRGPKSLCNACGIRQRKARRAMAEAAAAANGLVVAAADISSTKSKVPHNKEKKSRTSLSHVAQNRNKCKVAGADTSGHNDRKLSFKDLALSLRNSTSAFGRVFPQDEAEAAILLMELSCGLVHS
ncbi:hypothetical protein SLA2020_420760 [Shorea laevis]